MARLHAAVAVGALLVGIALGWSVHARRPAPPPPPDPAVQEKMDSLANEVDGLKTLYQLEKQNNADLLRGQVARP